MHGPIEIGEMSLTRYVTTYVAGRRDGMDDEKGADACDEYGFGDGESEAYMMGYSDGSSGD